MIHYDWIVIGVQTYTLLLKEPNAEKPLGALYNILNKTESRPQDLQVFFKWVDVKEIFGSPTLREYLKTQTIFTEGGPSSGWFAPPKGTHGPGSQGGSNRDTSDAEFLQVASTSNPDSTEPLGAGVTEALLVHYPDDGYGVVKPESADDGYHQGYSEVAAYEIAQALGFDDLVPVTVWTNDGKHTSQQFIENAVTGKEKIVLEGHEAFAQVLTSQQDRVRQMLILDSIIVNQDRHTQNYIFDQNGRLYAIDHGHASWMGDIYAPPKLVQNSGIQVAYRKVGPRTATVILLNKAELTALSGINYESFLARLDAAKIPQSESGTAWRHIQSLLSDGYIKF